MLLTISTNHQPAGDLGFLLHKHPARFQSFDLSFGQAHVFYPEVSEQHCRVCLLLDVDPIRIVRGRGGNSDFGLAQYVNDRPYCASSLMSVAIAQVFGSALGGRCKDRPQLASTPIPLIATLEALPVRGSEGFLQRLFEPLGYEVQAERYPLDEQFPEWGDSPYHRVTIRGTKTLTELLTHLYVLIPVFDNQKHYFVDRNELKKLLDKAGDWLATHPEKQQITRRYLKHRASLYREALSRLIPDEPADALGDEPVTSSPEQRLEETLSLNQQRHAVVVQTLKAAGARSVLDLGCGEGKLLRELLKNSQFERIVGLDVSMRALEIARRRVRIDGPADTDSQRLQLIHGSLIYRDRRMQGFDAAALVEVIEHLDPPRLEALERIVFEFARPKTVIITTPNQEYNVQWDSLPAGRFRHSDHRFEWNRQEFQSWAQQLAERYGYTVEFLPVGPVDQTVGPPTQMGLFRNVRSC